MENSNCGHKTLFPKQSPNSKLYIEGLPNKRKYTFFTQMTFPDDAALRETDQRLMHTSGSKKVHFIKILEVFI